MADLVMTTHEPFAEWAALAAVGALDGDEKGRFNAHLAAGCAQCEDNLAELSAVAADLPLALPDARPPSRLRHRILAELDQEMGNEHGPRGLRGGRATRVLWSGAAAAGIVLIAALWALLDTRAALERERGALARLEGEVVDQRRLTALVSGKDTAVATLAGSGKAARAEGWIVWSPGQRAGYIVVHFLPGVSADQQYQIWAVADDRSVPTAVFDVDDVGHAALMVSASVERPRRFVVTVEPRGGRAAPSGPIAMTGPVPW